MASQSPKSEPASEATRKGIRPIHVVALLVATLAAGGGGAAWYFSTQNAHAPAPKVEAPVPAPVFVVFDTITVNLQRGDEGDQYLQVGLTVQVSEQAHADMMKLYMPQLRSRLLLLLSSQKGAEIATEAGKQELVKKILTTIRVPYSERGPSQRVTNAFFTSFVIQ